MARTQGFEAVRAPPRKTARGASQGLVWMMTLMSPRIDSMAQIVPASFSFFAMEALSQTPERRKISFPLASKKTSVGIKLNPMFPGQPLVLENIDDQDMGFPGKFLSHLL